MNFYNQKRALGAIGIAVSLAALSSSSVKAATVFWDLNFYSKGGYPVGTGEFSYDDSAPLEGRIPGGMANSVVIDASENWYRLESFSANVYSLPWTLSDSSLQYSSWSPSGSNTGEPRGISFYRGNPPSKKDFWFFGYPGDSPNLVIYPSDPDLFRESPYFELYFPGGNATEGTWTATLRSGEAIPEGSTLLGSLMAIGILAYFKRLKLGNRS
jgi:hypothetical protein